MSDVKTVFRDWLITVEMPELRKKFPDEAHPNMSLHGVIREGQETACPEVAVMLEAAVAGLREAGYKTSLVLTEVTDQE